MEPLSFIEDEASTASTTNQEYVRDFISGTLVRATPEEIDAVQVFARRLVEDYGYPKDAIVTRPQFRVRQRPSARRGQGYPVDIAVFKTVHKLEDEIYIVVECKKKTVKDGEVQLKRYLTLCSAQIGVWFNGSDHLYIYKRYLPDGTIQWSFLPTIPKYGQSVNDIGSLRRKDLEVPDNLKVIFRDIRNHLAGNTTGITRDQELATQIMYILFCKIYDELDTAPYDLPRFRVSFEESVAAVASRIADLFAHVKSEYPDVFTSSDEITLDAASLSYAVGELQNFLITGATRDAIGDAFEVFIGPAVRGEGQFFTPRNVVQTMVALLDPTPDERIIDPACGSGGFLVVALGHIWQKLEEEGRRKGWNQQQLERKRREVAGRAIRGIDKDAFLTKVAKAYMAVIGDGRGGIFCEDSLAEPSQWSSAARAAAPLGTFDVVFTNPSFGSKIKVKGSHKLSQYTLARKWVRARSGDSWQVQSSYRSEQSPQVLFIERCIQLLKPGGRLGIVLPESIFGMSNYGYVVNYLLEKYRVKAIISLPEEVFQPYTHAKTCIVIIQNSPPRADDAIQMAIADWCGHDSRGNRTVRKAADGTEIVLDDIPLIADHMKKRLDWV